MLYVELEVVLTLKAPFLTQSSAVGAFGLDAPIARNRDNQYSFPRKLIKGCLRQAWRELRDATSTPTQEQIDHWLGEKSAFERSEGSLSSVEPVRGVLLFDDFQVAAQGSEKITTRIRIDEGRGAVDEGALQTIEAPFAAGAEIPFKGTINYLVTDEMEADEIEKWVTAGLRWITNLGALENVNFGQLIRVKVDPKKRHISLGASAGQGIVPEYLDITIVPLEPFCIAGRKSTTNIFESETIIPGGVWKGTFASTLLALTGNKGGTVNEETDEALNQAKLFGAEPAVIGTRFTDLRFTHAFPAAAGTKTRPVTPPLSLIKIDSPRCYDVALFEKPMLIGKLQAPSFFMDWKRRDDVDGDFGWANPPRFLTVQTAIENNRAKDQDLYAYEKIDPKGVEWYARIDLRVIENEEERGRAARQLERVLGLGLRGLSKTKTSAKIEVRKGGAIKDKAVSNLIPFVENADGQERRRWIVTLQTPALLCDPEALNESSGSKELRERYQQSWMQLSADSLTLVYYYASLSLAGGEYLYKRFQFGKPYNPYLLTLAGSVFALDAVPGKESVAAEHIKKWYESGFPLPQWAVERYSRNGNNNGNNWQNCPFIPQNGYGEIAVNLQVHWDKAPSEGERHEIC